MALTKAKKEQIVGELTQNIKNAKSIGFVQINGMTVSDFSNLRASLRTVDTNYTVVKKTLVKIAMKEALDMDLDLNLLPGQIGVICSMEESISGLSKTNDYIKDNFDEKTEIQKISWVASIFEGKFKEQKETEVIASMPSKETLLSRLVGSMQSPISGLARFFDAASKKLTEDGKEKVGELKGKTKEEKIEEPKEEEKKD